MSFLSRSLNWFKSPTPCLLAGHPALRFKATPVKVAELTSPKLKALVKQMTSVLDTKSHAPIVGVAAPLLGEPLRLIAYRIEDSQTLREHKMDPVPLTFLVNPTMEITDRKAKQEWPAEYESCPSVPSFNALVRRAEAVKVDALDLDGKPVTVTAKGFLARVIQHELDHLEGISYVEKMEPQTLRHDQYIDQYEMRAKQRR
ncbi:RNAPII degradation factor [Borealophlyctis nickersoniae]|nr:RNAPII degradation factor [Borealophlyctis nickersoniae]